MTLELNKLAKPLKVLKRIQETSEAVSLVLEIPENLKESYRYQAGQFVTFFLDLNGQALGRSYSLSSSPLVDNEFKVTIKKVPGGKGSTFLCETVKVGDSLLTTPPAGQFFKPTSGGAVHYHLFAAGSGITPIFSILKQVLKSDDKHKVSLIFCNKSPDSTIYFNELQQWEKQFASRLKISFFNSQGAAAGGGKRLTSDDVKKLAYEAKTANGFKNEFYLCGPTGFMDVVRQSLFDAGVARETIKEESFGTAVHAPKATTIAPEWTLIGPGQTAPDESPETVIAVIQGETVEAKIQPDQTILEALIEAGAQPPYSCMDGACMACLAKVTEGRVYQKDPGILMDDNINQNECLTCQAKPLSRIVRVSYDSL